MPYLKANLPLNQVAEVTILKRKGIVEGQFGPKMAYTMQYNGVVYDHEATQSEEGKGLSVMKEGERVHAKKVPNPHGKGEMIYWALPNGAEARALTQPVSNMQMDRNNKAASEYEKAKADEKAQEKEYWAKKDIGASLGMLVKIAMSKEADFDKALALAKEWRPKFQKAVEECYALDKYKAKEESPDTSVKVPLPDHIGAVFGEDVSPTL